MHVLQKNICAHACTRGQRQRRADSQAPAAIRELHRPQVPHNLFSVSSPQRDACHVASDQEACVAEKTSITRSRHSALLSLAPVRPRISPTGSFLSLLLPIETSLGRLLLLAPSGTLGTGPRSSSNSTHNTPCTGWGAHPATPGPTPHGIPRVE